jgi:predicted transcriptional regulator
MKTTGSNGADAIVQSATNGSSSSSSITATLAAFSDANNATFGGGAQGGGGVTITNGSGFSSLFKGTASDSNTAIMTEWKNSNDTTVDFSVSISSEVGIIGIEIAADVPPAGTSVVDVIGMGVVPFPR